MFSAQVEALANSGKAGNAPLITLPSPRSMPISFRSLRKPFGLCGRTLSQVVA